MSNRKEELMTISPSGGVRELREAIANYLKSFRGMLVDPDQIIIGAGTEYLYGIITELLGKEKIYAIENPGYKKLVNIYKQRDIQCRFASLDDKGITVDELKRVKAEVAHICPTHHFPTGITMPASRRYELLAWANASRDRYILEDDYDSEFRSGGRPLPTLFSIDGCEKVIYVNTFSKSLSPTIRISYMILPVHLANRYYEKLSFYACTVSNFEQYTLAEFIQQGYFEKHINRMRLFYMRRRKNIIENIKGSAIGEKCRIIENDAGLHFLLQVEADLNMQNLKELLLKNGIKVRSLDEYYLADNASDSLDKENLYIINYSRLNDAMIKEVLAICEHIFHSLKDND